MFDNNNNSINNTYSQRIQLQSILDTLRNSISMGNDCKFIVHELSKKANAFDIPYVNINKNNYLPLPTTYPENIKNIFLTLLI